MQELIRRLLVLCERYGITLKVTGTVSMQLSPKNVGLFEAFYASIKPIELMAFTIDVAPAGKLPEGTTELPFEFQMTPVKGQRLFETGDVGFEALAGVLQSFLQSCRGRRFGAGLQRLYVVGEFGEPAFEHLQLA